MGAAVIVSMAISILQEKYYSEKLGITQEDVAERRAVVDEYIRGLHWVLEYYYRCAPLGYRAISG